MFISMNMLEIIQILSVFFGTLVAAPLIVSKKAKKRMIGLFAVIAGSFFAMIVQVYLGLYYFVFANMFWLLVITPVTLLFLIEISSTSSSYISMFVFLSIF